LEESEMFSAGGKDDVEKNVSVILKKTIGLRKKLQCRKTWMRLNYYLIV